ncbi:hypothetical protein D7W82_17550 [Corallococcus sp. CA049B]|nr:hypothetical protein D7W82_17550 [Corallococcus sp. CA049B]
MLIHPGRTGYVYVMDRTTGQVLSATPLGHITTNTGVDLKMGRLQPVKGMETGFDKTVRGHLPRVAGVQGLVALRLQPGDGDALHPQQQPVP